MSTDSWYIRLIKHPAGAALAGMTIGALSIMLMTGVIKPAELFGHGQQTLQTMPLPESVRTQLESQAQTMEDLQKQMGSLQAQQAATSQILTNVQSSQNRIEDRMDRFFVRMESLASRR